MRTFFRQAVDENAHRFEVANARLAAGGYVLPNLDYFLQVDFCAKGQVRILDAYARFSPVKNFDITLGQMLVPFGSESVRAPWQYMFADQSLVFNYSNLRTPGLKLGYRISSLYLEGGVFNATDKSDHGLWNKAMSYALKAKLTTNIGITPQIGYFSRRLAEGRANIYDVAIGYEVGRFSAEAEVLMRCLGNHWNRVYSIYGDYGVPVKSKIIDNISFQARYDSESYDRKYGNDYACYRLTGGITASRKIGKLYGAFKINYEHYFYRESDDRYLDDYNNQLVAGLILHF